MTVLSISGREGSSKPYVKQEGARSLICAITNSLFKICLLSHLPITYYYLGALKLVSLLMSLARCKLLCCSLRKAPLVAFLSEPFLLRFSVLYAPPFAWVLKSTTQVQLVKVHET